MPPFKFVKYRYTRWFVAYCGWNARLSSPRSPPDNTFVEISRNGAASNVSCRSTRMRPACSTTNRRDVSPGGDVRYTGLANVPTDCKTGAAGGGGGGGGPGGGGGGGGAGVLGALPAGVYPAETGN